MWDTASSAPIVEGMGDWFAGKPLTVTFWLRTATINATVTLVGFFDMSAPFGGFGIALNNSGVGKLVYWGGSGAGANKISASNTYNDGNLHFCAVTVEGTLVSFFKDGVADGTDNTAQQPTAYSGTRRLFANSNGTAGFDGEMADIRIYNRALSPDAIWAMYDPKTRWDLYDTTTAAWISSGGGGGASTFPALTVAI